MTKRAATAGTILLLGAMLTGTVFPPGIAVLPSGTAAAQTFIDGTEDLPLAPDLVQAAEAGMVFDSPSGRILETFATGTTDRDSVLSFYAETLPSLGWTQLSPSLFQREGERLALDFFGADGALSVRFTLAPE